MHSSFRRIRVAAVVACAGGWLLVTGCLANLTQNVDLLLSPGAIGSAVRLPFSAVGGIAENFLRFTRFFTG